MWKLFANFKYEIGTTADFQFKKINITFETYSLGIPDSYRL